MSDRPNVLILHADQHRFDCLGCYGNADIRTPNIDALAADGVRYPNSFCPYPVCTPSRYSLLTGLYAHQHLGWNNHCTLPAGFPTFPRLLRDAGYRTKAVGKMHFTPTYLDVGFDELLLAEQHGPGRYDDDYHRWLQDEGLVDRIDLMDQVTEYRDEAPAVYWETRGAMPSNLDEAHHSTTWIGDRAMEAIGEWEGGGQLLMVGFMKPHHPFDPPAPWSEMYDPAALSLLPGWSEEAAPDDVAFDPGFFPHVELTEERLRRAMAHYYATISQIDHHIGRVIAELKRKGLYDDTLIVYTSDHGDYMGFRHLLLKGNRMYDPVVKVPLIVKWPDSARAGETCEALVNNVDLAPTLLQSAGVDVPPVMCGNDLAGDRDGREFIFSEAGHGGRYMIRSRSRKLLLDVVEDRSCFFDLEQDPLERENLYHAPEWQDEIAQHRRRLSDWLLFESVSPVHLDETARVVQGDNVLGPETSHRASIEAYFRKQMQGVE